MSSKLKSSKLKSSKQMRINLVILMMFLVLALVGCQTGISAPAAEEDSVLQTTTALEATTEATTEATADNEPTEGFLPGNKAIDFELKNMAGETVRLSDFKGKTVVLNFFASWCPPCQVEMPHINKVYETMKDQDVVIIGVNLTAQDNMDDLKKLLEENSITFPIVLDEKSEVATSYAIRSIPVNVVINAEGIVTEYAIGAVNEETLTGYIEAAKVK